MVHRYRGFEEKNRLEVGNAERDYSQQDGSNQSHYEAGCRWTYAAHFPERDRRRVQRRDFLEPTLDDKDRKGEENGGQ